MPRAQQLSRLLFIGYVLGLLYVPLQYGGNRDFAWGAALVWFCLLGALTQLAVGMRWIDPPGVWYQTRWWRRGLWLWLAYGVLQWIPLPIDRAYPVLPPIQPYEASSWNTLSVDAYSSFRSSLKTLLYVQIALLGLLLLSSWRRITVLLWSLVALATLQAAVGTVAAIQDLGFRSAWFSFSAIGVSGTYLNKNHFAGYLVLSIGFALALIIADLRDGPAVGDWKQRLRDLLQLLLTRKTQLRLAMLIMVVALVMTASRGGNAALLASLGLVSMLALFLIRKPPRMLWILLVSLVAIDVLIISGWFGLDRLAERIAQTDVRVELRQDHDAGSDPATDVPGPDGSLPAPQSSVELARGTIRLATITEIDRVEVARATREIWKVAPVFGVGGGAWRSMFPAFRTAETSRLVYDHAHHDHLQVLAEYGVIGTLIAAVLVAWPVLLAIRSFRDRRDRRMIGLAFGALLGILALLMHGFVDFNLQIPGNAALFTLALTLCLIAHNSRYGDRDRDSSPKKSRPMVVMAVGLLLVAGSANAQTALLQSGNDTCPRAPSSYTRSGLDATAAATELARIPTGVAGADQRAKLLIRVLNEAARADALDHGAEAEALRQFAKSRLTGEGWRSARRIEEAEVAFALGEQRRLGLTNIPQDAAKACQAYAIAAQRGSPDGIYREALCATQDGRDRALAIMRRAAEAGHPLAQEALGTLCLQSEPPRVDCIAHWFCRAANQGLTRAAVLAAWLLSEERSTVRDVPRALELYEQAATAGDASAQNNLAEIYERGWAGTTDMPRAMELYRASSRQGLPQAQLNLARLLFKTSEPGSERRREALRWLAEARPKLPKEAQAVETEFGLLGR